jgi:hypothetical protein
MAIGWTLVLAFKRPRDTRNFASDAHSYKEFASNVPRAGNGNEVLCGLLIVTVMSSAASAADTKAKQKQEDRLQNAGTVMDEVLNISDNIPRELLDKTKCVVVLPSAVKAAFIFGGSYGRGAMVCRSGKDFTGTWGAPAIYVLEGGSFGFQFGWGGYRLGIADHE